MLHIDYTIKRQGSESRVPPLNPISRLDRPATFENVGEAMAIQKSNSARRITADLPLTDISNPLNFAKMYQKQIKESKARDMNQLSARGSQNGMNSARDSIRSHREEQRNFRNQ